MNAIRRILLALHSILLLAACGVLFALAWNQEKKLDLQVRSFNLQAFIVSGDSARAVFTAFLAIVALIAFLSLLAAVWRESRPRSKGVLQLRQEDGGIVEVSAASIEALLRDAVQALPEIRRAEPRVDVRSGAVESRIDAVIEPSVSIAGATKRIVDTVHAALREQVGVTSVRRPVIRISYDELAARPIGAYPGTPPPAAPPPPAPIFPAARAAPETTVQPEEPADRA
ncbi:alkaline shock response membrane anchor protein AmaP [Tepidiforma sp.]|uniref:alkaline shock response membrane anchor protein AmaP n=1 Tax=Tepidiforma sp. TaxID=2682230 RepID=UPI002ADDDD3C|nr:alkaline shock response membrane anchor protein AmaP [Tepidiforma sp.]